jgi:hypothetical protein
MKRACNPISSCASRSAAESDLAGVIGQMRGALRQQHHRLGALDDPDQHRRRPDRAHRGDRLQHRIEIVVAARRQAIRIGQAGRHVEAKPLPRAREEILRGRGHADSGRRGFHQAISRT